MGFRIYLVFRDGRRDLEDEIDNLEEAASFALKLADEIGQRPVIEGFPPPVKVEIFKDDRMELSVQIMSGGLFPHTDVPRFRSR